MSFQRILETARRMGSPLIVTDAAGREPMVVMTLQMYERIGEGVSQVEVRQSQNAKPESEEPTVTEFATMALQAPSQASDKVEPPLLLREIAINVMESPEMAQDSEISLEERFYLEPSDEESK